MRQFLSMMVLVEVLLLSQTALAIPSLICSNPVATAVSGGGGITLNVICTISNLSGINSLTSGMVSPATILLTSGSNTLTATLQSTVTSPNGSVSLITGTSSGGFLGVLSDPTSTLQFQYLTATTSSTPPGNYISGAGATAFNWTILSILGGNNIISSGTANSTLEVDVPAPPTVVSCTSPGVNAPSGGGSFTINVNCTISTSGTALSPSASNTFSPNLLTLTNGSNSLTATLNSLVSSPDGSVTGITGTAASGFSGTIHSLPATIQAQYTGSINNTTPSGTYNSENIMYLWSVL